MLDIKLLAGYQLTYDGIPVNTVNQPRLQSMLAYLLLHRSAQIPRHHLAFSFWPDVSESQARNNLRQTLHQLRHALPDSDHFFLADVNSVCWLPDVPYQLDVAEFELAAARVGELESSANPQATFQALQSAVSFYTGDLLPSCYDDWIAPERERLRNQYQRLLIQLIDLLEEQRDYAVALDYTQRLLQFDPLREETYLYLMRLHALNGNRAGALRMYYDCAANLRRELAVEPGAEIQDAYRRLLHLDTAITEQTVDLSVPSSAMSLIGRQVEWDALRRAWRHSISGQPQFTLITGEAGIGKTRLAEELLGWLQKQGIATARTRAYQAEGRLAYSPVTEWLRSNMIFPMISQLDNVWRSDVARLLPELLTQYPDLPHPEPLTEYGQRQRFFEALARGVLAVMSPLLLLIDDLQWCDPETLEWLHFLMRFDSQARLLIVGTARAEEMKDNEALSTLLRALQTTNQIDVFSLAPLDASETAKLATSIADYELDEMQALRLFRETEGNPLFVGEMVRAELNLGVSEVDNRQNMQSYTPSDLTLPVPPKVYSIITGRLHHLSPSAYKLTGIAATIGRAFTSDVLIHASRMAEDDLMNTLEELWQRRIIREQVPNRYDFSHDKLREVAYTELSPIQRRKYHLDVAKAVEFIYASDLDSVSAQLAAHYEVAGLAQQALPYYLQAASVAQRVYAHDEAISLLRKGLTVLQMLPQSREKDELELALQIALGISHTSLKGYAALEVVEDYNRAQRLCEQLGKPPSPQMLRALVLVNIVMAKFQRTREVADQLLHFAEQEKNQMLIVEGHYSMGVASFYPGDFELSCAHLKQAIAHYDPQFSYLHIVQFTQDPKVVCLIRLALDLWCLGYPDQAEQRRQEALAYARALSHPFTMGYCLSWDATFQSVRLDVPEARKQAEAAKALGAESRMGIWPVMGRVIHGWAVGESGAVDIGMAELEDGIAELHSTRVFHLDPIHFSLLIRLQMKVGKIELAQALVAEAFAKMETSGEHWCEAELYRYQAELLLLQGEEVEAEATLKQAIQVSRAQKARSFELRASTRLAQLWQQQGKRAEAHQLLSSIYSWFTEGLDTPDLKDARALLNLLER